MKLPRDSSTPALLIRISIRDSDRKTVSNAASMLELSLTRRQSAADPSGRTGHHRYFAAERKEFSIDGWSIRGTHASRRIR
jgi:hypothetical protein